MIDQAEQLSPGERQGRVPPFVCPIDRAPLTRTGEALACSDCGTIFPIVRGVPVLINDANSVFRIADYSEERSYAGASSYAGSLDRSINLRRAYRGFAHALAEAPLSRIDFDPLAAIRAQKPDARILVIGSGERELAEGVVLTDVTFARNVDCVCDAHDLPFADGSFDAVIAEAVLEHVCDPQRVVAEVVRVLGPDGLVFAVTPFLQPVHMGAYDFTRFTYLGHRRLFRRFDDLGSGLAGGPTAAGILITRSLLTSLTDRPNLRSVLRLIGLLLTWPLRWLDRPLSRTRSAYNVASATWFFGRKRATPISDREIIDMFRGA